MSVISLRSVSKSYLSAGVRLAVLREFDLDVDAGEFVAVSGPSGSGKSTLLNLIGGLDHPDSGTVRIDGTDLARHDDGALARFRNEKLGFVFQSFHLVPVLSAMENVAWPLVLKGVDRRRRVSRSKELLAAGRARRAHATHSGSALRRAAPAGRDRPGARLRSEDRPGRRADREPRPQDRPGDHGALRIAEPGGRRHIPALHPRSAGHVLRRTAPVPGRGRTRRCRCENDLPGGPSRCVISSPCR